MEYRINIPDEILAEFSTWQKVAGIKIVVDGDQVDIHLASDSAAVASAIRSERTPKVASQPGDSGNIRWK